MIYVLYLIHILISVFLILVVLLQQGKGADLSVFGGGASQAAFGARGAATVLHKLTVICFVLFIVTTLSIGILQSSRRPTVMGGLESEAASTEGETSTLPPGGELPASEDEAPAAGGPEAEAGVGEEGAATEPPPEEESDPGSSGAGSGGGS